MRLDGKVSSWAEVERGVPQGSLLGPLFFNIFINDVTKCVRGVALRLYADDTTLYCSDLDPAVLAHRVNQGLETIRRWFEANGMVVNPRKTQAMVMGNRGGYRMDLNLGGQTIEEAGSLKLLGFILDKRLTYQEQVRVSARKASQKAGALNRVKRILPERTLVTLYKAFVLPHLEYCSPLLISCDKGSETMLEKQQERALRVLMRRPKDCPYEVVLREANLSSLKQRRLGQSLGILYRATRGLGPEYIREMVEFRGNAYNLRREMTVILPRPRKQLGRRSFIYEAGTMWNGMPNNVRLSPNIAIFWKRLELMDLGALGTG